MMAILQVCLLLIIISTLTFTSAETTYHCYDNVYCNCFEVGTNHKAYFCKEPSIRDLVILNVRYTARITHIEIECDGMFNQPDYNKLFVNLDEWTLNPVNFTILQSAVPDVPFVELFNIFGPENTVTNFTFTKAKRLPCSNAPPILESNHFSKLDSVIILDLSENDFEVLPEQLFTDMVNLQTLLLNGNHLRKLPVKIFEPLKILKSLDLSGNRLISLDGKHFSKLDSVVILDLSDNSFEYLPEQLFADMVNLETLLLSGNRLEALPVKIFSSLKNLKTLNLSGNQLSSLDKRIFRYLSSLETLNLNGSKLHHQSFSLVRSQRRLQDLQLAGNQLTMLTRGFFRKLKNLNKLNPSGNKLNNPSKLVFSPLTELKHLQLAKNNMNVLKDGVFEDLKNLETVNLDGNKLNREPEQKSWLEKLGSTLEETFKATARDMEKFTPRFPLSGEFTKIFGDGDVVDSIIFDIFIQLANQGSAESDLIRLNDI